MFICILVIDCLSCSMTFFIWRRLLSSRKSPNENSRNFNVTDIQQPSAEDAVLEVAANPAFGHNLQIQQEIEERLRLDLVLDIDQIHELPESSSSIGSPNSSIFAYPTKPVRESQNHAYGFETDSNREVMPMATLICLFDFLIPLIL